MFGKGRKDKKSVRFEPEVHQTKQEFPSDDSEVDSDDGYQVQAVGRSSVNTNKAPKAPFSRKPVDKSRKEPQSAISRIATLEDKVSNISELVAKLSTNIGKLVTNSSSRKSS